MVAENKYNPSELSKNQLIELDCQTTKKIFQKLKRKGILKDSVCYYKEEKPSTDLLNSNDFIDQIKYYRLLNKISKRELSSKIGIHDETYRQYELKKFEIQDNGIAEKMIKALNLENVLELPDYFKIMKAYSIEDIKELILKYTTKKEFALETNINISTVNYWFQKNAPKSLSTYTYRRIVKFFNKYNIEY